MENRDDHLAVDHTRVFVALCVTVSTLSRRDHTWKPDITVFKLTQ